MGVTGRAMSLSCIPGSSRGISSVGEIFLKIHTFHSPCYKRCKFGCNWSKIKGTLFEEQCAFQAVSRLPLQVYNIISQTMRNSTETLAMAVVILHILQFPPPITISPNFEDDLSWKLLWQFMYKFKFPNTKT